MSHKIETRHFLNGEFVTPSPNAETFTLFNPATEEEVAKLPCATKEEIDLAVKHAKAALPIWQAKTPSERAQIMRKFGELAVAKAEELAWLEAQSMGLPTQIFKFLIGYFANVFPYLGGLGETIVGQSSLNTKDHINFTLRQPFGVTAGILPFNAPVIMWGAKVGPAVAAGNAIIIKSSEKAPLTSLLLTSLTAEAGFPPGLIQAISGAGVTGKILAEHMEIRKISFTGSTRTGRLVAQAAAASNLKNVSLELGGKSPLIIFPDADLDKVATDAAMSMTLNSGQTCIACSRVYAHESIYDEFLKKYMAQFAGISAVQGDPLGQSVHLGPQADSIQFKNVMGYIESGKKEGADILIGGSRFGDKGSFVKPTIFTNVPDDSRINKEEIFGPVGIVHKFKDEKEVIERANNTEYGLWAAVYTKDIDRAMRVSKAIESGTVSINSCLPDTADMPFGGWKSSGIGRENGPDSLEGWLEVKSVILKYQS